eukprot:8570975-Pyramimonas_sp.AAC.1
MGSECCAALAWRSSLDAWPLTLRGGKGWPRQCARKSACRNSQLPRWVHNHQPSYCASLFHAATYGSVHVQPMLKELASAKAQVVLNPKVSG